MITAFDQWNRLMTAFRREYGREPTKEERKAIGKASGYNPKVKTKGKARDLQCKGATPSTARRSESVMGGIAADNRSALYPAKPRKAARMNKPESAKP